jgi:hypothetical protein
MKLNWPFLVVGGIIGGLFLFGLFLLTNPTPNQPNQLEAFLDRNNAQPKVREAYLFAQEHGEVLDEVPCFCGCEAVGHQDDLDCFFKDNGQFEKMGLNCGGCVAVALDSKRLFEEGQSTEEIRDFITKKYGGGR